MKSSLLFTDKEITIKEMVSNNSGLHKHHYFEMIYVLDGTGIHNINNNRFNFSVGDVFLLTPDDAHTFEIDDPVKFLIVDFTENFFSKNRRIAESKNQVNEIYKQLEFIFHNHHNAMGNIVASNDKDFFDSLTRQLVKEKDKKQFFDEIIIQDIIFLMLHIIARSIQDNISLSARKENPKSRVHEITAYIQQYIYENENIKITNLASKFGKSSDHLNRYFKNEMGITLKDYITQYKLSLVKTRLKFSDLTIAEIAAELNYTDESHLNKIFKNVYGKTAKQYKNENE
jgi:AraC-like DNA-binding protein/mannose-6-phosphate isomerase-like protein (cupin superfamily)